MLNRITASGWKSGRVDIELGKVNLLVGGNGSGKSSVFDAVCLALFGRTQGLGKANQSLSKGMNQDFSESVVRLTGDDGDRTVSLKRKGQSVSKSSSEDLEDPEVPVSVEELRALTPAELRTLMSSGGSYSSEEFRQHIASLLSDEETNALHRCIIQGHGGLGVVDMWVQSINDQEKAEASNLREMKAALVNIEKVIANMKPVPASVLADWEKERASLFAERGQVAKLAADHEKTKVRLINAINDLEAAKKRAEQEHSHAKEVEANVRHVRSLQRSHWGEEEAKELLAQAAKLRQEIDAEVRQLTRRSQNSRLFDSIAEKVGKVIAAGELDKESQPKAEAIVQAAEELSAILMSPDSLKDADEIAATTPSAGEVERLEAQANELLAPLQAFKTALAEMKADSLDHAELMLSKAKLEASVSDKAVTEKEKIVAELGSSPEDLSEKLAALDARILELSTGIANAKEYEDAVATEQKLRLNIAKCEANVEAIKAVSKAAVKVHAQYLAEPIRNIRSHLDDFCEAAGLPKIDAAFEKVGRATTLQIYSSHEGANVSLDALSGGEKLLIGTAFLYAINRLRNPKHKLIFVEAAELDSDNTIKILQALTMAGDHGIQSFVTSFVPVECSGTTVHEMAVTV